MPSYKRMVVGEWGDCSGYNQMKAELYLGGPITCGIAATRGTSSGLILHSVYFLFFLFMHTLTNFFLVIIVLVEYYYVMYSHFFLQYL